MPAWTDRARWLAQVTALVRTPEGETARAAAHVALDTLLRVAAADAATADTGTGRNVTTAHDTVAASLGMSGKTVQRARILLERLGLAVTIVSGRYLTTTERAAARTHHGGPQLRAASTRALTSPKHAAALTPQPSPVENVQLPRRGHPAPTRRHPRRTATRLAARRQAAWRTPIPVGVQQLAAQLAVRMPWLARHRHIGALARLLARHRLSCDTGWTATRLLDVLEAHNRATGHVVPDPASQRNPLGYLHTRLAAATLPSAAAPLPRSVARPVAGWRLEHAERQRQIAAEDPAWRAAVIAALRAQITAEHVGRLERPMPPGRGFRGGR